MGHYESSVNRKVHSTECQIKKVKQAHTRELTAYLKALEQKEAASPRRSGR